jgi:hypothetical protein
MDLLQAASSGGQATYDFYSGEAQARQELAQLVAKGDQAWTLHQTAAELGYSFLANDHPAYVATGTKGQLILQTQLSTQVLQSDCPDYKEAGIATMYVVHGNTPVDVFTTTVEKVGPGVVAAALAPALATLLGALKTFVTTFFTEVSEAAAAGTSAADAATVAGAAAETAAESAAVDGEIVADELALSIEFGPLAIVGLVVAALTIVFLVLSFGLAKTMTAWIRVYNASTQTFQLGIAYTYNLSVVQQPKDGVLPPPGTPSAPPGVQPTSEVVYHADYVLQNVNSWKGLALVLQAPPTDQTQGFSLLIDIPDAGENSVQVTADGALSAANFFAARAGKNTELASADEDNGLTVHVGTNQLKGESPGPVDGVTGYNYEYVLLVS